MGAVVFHERFAPTMFHPVELNTEGVFAYSLLNKGAVVGQGRMVIKR
jgi:hypothetical protein